MSYRTMLVHLDGSARSNARLSAALRLARAFGAHLTGMYATFEPDPRAFYVIAGTSEYFETHRQLREERRGAIERLFNAELARAQIEGEWLAATGDADRSVVHRARTADLVIVGQSDPADPDTYVANHFPETVVMSSGTPVLVVPNAGSYESIDKRVLIAWNGSREAARALHDAMPLIERAAHVTVVGVATAAIPPATLASCADVAAVLARHGVATVEVERINSDIDETAGDALLSHAADGGYDLLVMGAYGHTRWQEMLLGGATRTMFDSLTLPVLMSH